MHIRLLLATVTENLQFRRILAQLLNEIRNHGPQLQPWPDDVRKAKRPHLHSMTVGVHRQQRFLGEFRRAVHTDRFQRGVIFRRRPRSLPIHRRRGGKCDPITADGLHSFQNGRCQLSIRSKLFVRIVGVDRLIRSAVKDERRLLVDRLPHNLRLTKVTLNDRRPIRNPLATAVAEIVDDDTEIVFHLAADKAVDADDPDAQFRSNTTLSANVLERAREVDCEGVAFTSSSTVYGEAPRPTPEDYAPLEPISAYGAAKLAEESLCSVYAHSYGVRAWVFRFANVVGPRLQRGAVIPDFIHKLREDPTTLEILGDGRQEKSYMHVDDCVDAMCHVVREADAPVNTYNLGTRTTTSARRIADIVAAEMDLDPTYEYTGGDRGWVGDVPRMRLSIEKLAALGWEPSGSSDEAVRRATRELLERA